MEIPWKSNGNRMDIRLKSSGNPVAIHGNPIEIHRFPRNQFAGPTAQGVLDLVSYAVFACFCTIFFDKWRRPGGSAGESVTPGAHSRLTRGLLAVPPMFPEAFGKP